MTFKSPHRYLPVAVLASLLTLGCQQQADEPGEGTAAESAAQNTAEAAGSELSSDEQKISYIMGMNIGTQISSESFEVDLPALRSGIEDAVAKREPRLSEAQVTETIEAFQTKVRAEQEKAAQIVAENNAEEGSVFLSENAKKEGVVVLESGLQYKVLTEGSGSIPSADNVVEVHYKGTLIDGTEFDSSYSRGEPARFGVTQVIPGWVEALQLMKEGAKWELYVPAELAYGSGGTGGLIGPNQALIFEVELLKASVSDEG